MPSEKWVTSVIISNEVEKVLMGMVSGASIPWFDATHPGNASILCLQVLYFAWTMQFMDASCPRGQLTLQPPKPEVRERVCQMQCCHAFDWPLVHCVFARFRCERCNHTLSPGAWPVLCTNDLGSSERAPCASLFIQHATCNGLVRMNKSTFRDSHWLARRHG
eukprot:1157705-Pelagomonas_calceolata.AAC.6